MKTVAESTNSGKLIKPNCVKSLNHRFKSKKKSLDNNKLQKIARICFDSEQPNSKAATQQEIRASPISLKARQSSTATAT